MAEYTIEAQGLNTYRVYENVAEEKLDTVAIGMMQNNSIAGMLPMQVIHRDNICSLQFNISSRVTLQQFLLGGVSRDRFLKVIKNILDSIMQMEEYLLEPGQLLLNVEDIYVNVGTLEVVILYYPVLGDTRQIDLNSFIKEILFSTEFNRNENSDYVVLLMNYLNTSKEADILELKKKIEEFLVSEKRETVQVRKEKSVPVMARYGAVESPMSPIAQTTPQSPVPPQPMPEAVKPQKEKKSLFGKKEKAEKRKEKKREQALNGIEIPGLEQVAVKKAPVQASGPVAAPEQAVAPYEKMQVLTRQREAVNFGETTVLQAPTVGETTVLGAQMQENTVQRKEAALERQRTGEIIPICKEYFRLGKESQYADYCIADNPAVSRSHADIIKQGEDCFIKDNNSLNHTFVNDEQIQAQTPRLLQDGDRLKLADEEFIYKLLTKR